MRFVVLLLAAVTVPFAGCATWQKPAGADKATKTADAASSQEAGQAEAKAEGPLVETEAPQADLPKIPLSSEILYDVLLAEIAANRGHISVAIDLYKGLAERTRDPRLAERATRMAVYGRQREAALTSARLWVEVAPQAREARQLLTALLIQNGELDSAVEHLEAILRLAGGDSQNAYMSVAGLLSREKDKRAALHVMERFVAKRQDNAKALYAYGYLAMRLGETDKASGAIDRVLKLRPDWTVAMIQKGRLLKAAGQVNDSLEYLQGVVQAHPEAPDLRLVYARTLADARRVEAAYDQFEVLLELRPGNDDAMFAISLLALQLKRLDTAEKYLTELKKQGKRGYEVDYYMGRLAELREDFKEAKRRYSAIGNGEYYLNAQIRMAVLTAQQGDMAGARARLDALKTQRPAQKLRLYLVEGEILRQGERYQTALTLYEQALEEFPDNEDLLYAHYVVAEELDMMEVAEADLRRILKRDPNNAEALNALGYSLADRTTRYEEALELITRALELRPNDYYIVDSMGWVQYRLGNYEKAVEYLRRALNMQMDSEVAAHLGEVLWVMGQEDAARDVWQRALDSDINKHEIVREVMQKFLD